MTTIAGVARFDGAAAHDDLTRLVQLLAHRFANAPASVAASPTSHPWFVAAAQWVAATPGIVVAIEGRIDNLPELCTRLALPADASAAQVAAAGYGRWGSQLAGQLDGDFAFAIWDGPKATLVLARDPVGVRPLYYRLQGSKVLFASELRALLACGSAPAIDEARVADYLIANLPDKERTFFQGIWRVPPGHVLELTAGAIRANCYWSAVTCSHRPLADQHYVPAFTEALERAVRVRLRDASRPGALLSGGLDSSALVGFALPLADELDTFSATFSSTPDADERAYIRCMEALPGVRSHRVDMSSHGPLADLDASLAEQAEPFMAPNLYMHRLLYRAARASGTSVLLDGLDGDTTVSHGERRLAELAIAGRFRQMAHELAGVARARGRSVLRVAADQVLIPLSPGLVRQAFRQLRWSGKRRDQMLAPLQPDFARRVAVVDRLHQVRQQSPHYARTAETEHRKRVDATVVSFLLEKADVAAAHAGIEPRYPFMDRRLIELCISMPSHWKLRDGWDRYVLRRAVEGRVPATIQWRRRKSNLGPGFTHALLRQRRRLQPMLEDPGELGRYAKLSALQGDYQRLVEHGDAAAGLRLWRAVTVWAWLRSLEQP